MDVNAGQQRRFPAVAIVVVLFILCIVPGQYLIAKQFPAMSGLVQINPSVVFLEIPIQLPVAIDLILAPALFLLIYPVVLLLFSSGRRNTLQRVRAAFTGLLIVLCCMLLGAGIYYLVQDHLPTQIRTGINSLGINAAIHLSYPTHETINLQGSLVLLVCFIIGMFICIRKIRKEPDGGLTREQRMTPYERMLQEKRMNGKQMKQEARNILPAGMHHEERNTNNNGKRAAMELATIHTDRNHAPGACYNQSVITLRPEALYYMPR